MNQTTRYIDSQQDARKSVHWTNLSDQYFGKQAPSYGIILKEKIDPNQLFQLSYNHHLCYKSENDRFQDNKDSILIDEDIWTKTEFMEMFKLDYFNRK